MFCRIVKGDAPAHVVYRDDSVIAFLDKYPLSRGHTLVAPLKHYEFIYEVPDDLLARLISVAKTIALAQVRGLGATGVRIVQNNGRDAKQIIPHVHFHVIPFYGPCDLRRKLLGEDEGREVASELRKAIERVRG